MNSISTNRVIKIGIVTDDAERTADAFAKIFTPVAPYDVHDSSVNFTRAPSKEYLGKPAGNTPLKVRLFYLEPVYMEIVEPLGDAASPWHEHLKKFGTSVCFISVYIDGFEQHIDFMGKIGYPATFVEEKGYERYAYFDTLRDLGFTLEMKETSAK